MRRGWKILIIRDEILDPVLKSYTRLIKTCSWKPLNSELPWPLIQPPLLMRGLVSIRRVGERRRHISRRPGASSSPPRDLAASPSSVKQTPTIHLIYIQWKQYNKSCSVTHKTFRCNFPSRIRWIQQIQQQMNQTPSTCRSHCWSSPRCPWLQWSSQSLHSLYWHMPQVNIYTACM